ncbi:SAM-dependent methyltransferase [Streptomyces celluloflavus]|uniref:SAM-dependent methyltransferase n=1 Tax=Streptomyces celluloflavus TaxID=58344 RepID=UPI00345F362F|nr:class I SAM-dependent methyltransferase [Streptomyces celluloflavus]
MDTSLTSPQASADLYRAADGPSTARLRAHWLGGHDTQPADRRLSVKVLRRAPGIANATREGLRFTDAAVRALADKGMRQAVILGQGYPTKPYVHDAIAHPHRETRALYVTHDTIVIAHARALLTSRAPASCTEHLQADFTQPETVLESPHLRHSINLSEPIVLVLDSVLHFHPDAPGRPMTAVIGQYLQALAPGSAIVITHLTSDFDAHSMDKAAALLQQTGVPFQPRSRQQILDLVADWRRLAPKDAAPYAYLHPAVKPPLTAVSGAAYAVIARKPGAAGHLL